MAKSFHMYKSAPIGEPGAAAEWSHFRIDGKMVSKAEFDELNRIAVRQDTFHSYSKRGRYVALHCVYI